MYDPDEKRLIYFDDEEHLIRRLGSAVVACWSDLPIAAQEMLVAHAQMVVDENSSDNLEAEMTAFLASHLRPAR